MNEELYDDYILDHYECPYHKGHLECPTCAHAEKNPLCGDLIRLELKLDDAGKVQEAYFNGKGCAISQASASMLTDELIGKSLDDIKKMDKQFILDLLGIPLGPTRIKCALLPLKVIKPGAYGINTWPDEEDED